MTIWQPRMDGRDGPMYTALADAISDDIEAGRLEAGQRLPTHRDLSYRLGVTVGTVSRAYAEAERRGLTRGEVGRGTFVRDSLSGTSVDPFVIPADRHPDLIDLGLNVPSWNLETPVVARLLADLSRANDLSSLIHYQPERGRPAHREAGARWLRRIGLEVPPGRVLVTCGAQHGMLVSLMTIAQPGDLILTEDLTFPGFKALANRLHLHLRGLPTDQDGVLPDALEAACRSGAAKAFYCIPTLHNPTTTTMSGERRRAVAEIARRHRLFIIEDDVYGFFPESRPPPIAALAPNLTFLVTSTSKCLAGGLRIGYLAAPEGLVADAGAAIRTTVWFAPSLSAEIATRWILDGSVDEVLSWQRRELTARHELARDLLPVGTFRSQPSSFHVWLDLPEPWRGEEFVAELRRRNVVAVSAETFAVGRGQPPHAIRLCLCGEPDRERVRLALEIVAETLRQPPGSGSGVI